MDRISGSSFPAASIDIPPEMKSLRDFIKDGFTALFYKAVPHFPKWLRDFI